jgi:hypothetical protein
VADVAEEEGATDGEGAGDAYAGLDAWPGEALAAGVGIGIRHLLVVADLTPLWGAKRRSAANGEAVDGDGGTPEGGLG